jgi:N utilization substance protein A
LAIGKRGQNTRLTERLTGWKLSIEAESLSLPGFEEKVQRAVQELATVPGISRDQAILLVNVGFHSLEDLLQAEVNDLSAIPELDGNASTIVEAARAEHKRRTIGIE